MSVATSEYRQAMELLPSGAMLVFHDVSWEDYERLLATLEDRKGLRISYDEGTLEVMSPLPEHEEYKDSIYRMACAFAEEMGINLETRGSATWNLRNLHKGAEPDTCFYVTSAARIIGKRKIDLETDSPPDVVVEIDTTSPSRSKFKIYAALGVPELWRYDGMSTQIHELTDGRYSERNDSRFFPGLSSQMITDFVAAAKTEGQTKSLSFFRRRLRAAISRRRKRG